MWVLTSQIIDLPATIRTTMRSVILLAVLQSPRDATPKMLASAYRLIKQKVSAAAAQCEGGDRRPYFQFVNLVADQPVGLDHIF